MARLEIPSIVVHKGSRLQSQIESPTVACAGMPAVPSSRHNLFAGANSSSSDMNDGNAKPICDASPVSPALPLHPDAPFTLDKSETQSKNLRNRTNAKVKQLVRSHAMRESTSPPRETFSPSSPQSVDNDKKLGGSLPANSKSLNNNESMLNSNLCPVQSPKQMRNSATSPTCQTPSRNGQSSPAAVLSPKNSTSPINTGKPDGQRTKVTSPKCNNCARNNHHHDRPGLLQTPVSPMKTGQGLQHSPKSTNLSSQNNPQKCEQRRQNALNVCGNQCSAQCGGNTLSVSRPGSRHKLRHQNSSQGSFDSASPCLSRDSSTELYTDSTGIDLEQFIADTLNRNQKDRTVLLKIEKDLIEFAKDRQKVCHKFPNMSSYNRMLVHRVAAYFGMEHNVDQSGLSVIVTRTKNMRIPDTRFKEHVRDDFILTEEPRRSILKRDSSSFEDCFNFKSPDRMAGGEYCRRSKSFEEREEEYERARRRIFKENSGDGSEVAWPCWSSSESSDVSARYRLLHPSDHSSRQTRLLKVESFDGRESFRAGMVRPSVSKSFSFGGYTGGMLTRGDSVTSTHSAGARLMKQDSGTSMCSRLSPSSSGYKSQSQRSDATISPSPSPSPVAPTLCSNPQATGHEPLFPELNNHTVMWAVSSISTVPAGSIIINPQTNQPYTNPDGSVYRFDLDNPPKIFSEEEEEEEEEEEAEDREQEHAQEEEQQLEEADSKPNQPEVPVKPGEHKKRSSVKCSSGASVITMTTMTTSMTTTTTMTHVTNSSTSPSLPFTPPPQLNSAPPQPLVKAPTVPAFNQPHQPAQHPYASYLPSSESYNQGVYQQQPGQSAVMMAPPQPQGQGNGQGEVVYNQNPVYANYPVPVQAPMQQSGDIPELSSYFMGMNMYDQRAGGDGQPSHPQHYPQSPQPSNQPLPHVHSMPPNYWQQSPSQMPAQQTMYFVPPPPTTALSVSQNPPERQPHAQQQRYTTTYSFNPSTVTAPSQTTPNYVSGFPVPYSSVPAVTPTPGEYPYQPPVHMVPTYYPPAQPGMQPPPVMYRVPTPPNTPNSNQISGLPLMYLNSTSYCPPAMVSAGTFGPSGTPPAPPYISPALVPNLVFRQNVPVVANVRASTPGGSQRASRSPTPAHEQFACNSMDRNAQTQQRYPMPMYQGLHIVQGDMRLMHPGVPGNSRLQYTPVLSPPVVQGCPRPYRPASYSLNASGACTPNSFDGRSQKLRKQRSKIATLPPTGVRPSMYQNPPMPSMSSNAPKDIREGTVKVTITRRNQLVQY